MRTRLARTFKLSFASMMIVMVALMALVSTGGRAYAADCTGSAIIGTGGSASCDVGINIQAQAGDLTATPPVDVTLTSGTGTITGGTGTLANPYTYTLNGASQNFNLAFTTLVSDGRGGSTGWKLEASISAMPTGSQVDLNTVTPTCTSTCFPTAGSLSTNVPLTLNGTSTKFVGAPNAGANTNAGDYSIATAGLLTMPAVMPASTVNGKMTITIVDADF